MYKIGWQAVFTTALAILLMAISTEYLNFYHTPHLSFYTSISHALLAISISIGHHNFHSILTSISCTSLSISGLYFHPIPLFQYVTSCLFCKVFSVNLKVLRWVQALTGWCLLCDQGFEKGKFVD